MITTAELTRTEWTALINGFFGVKASGGIPGASPDVVAMFDAELRLATPEYECLRAKLKAMPPEQLSALITELCIVNSDVDTIEDFLASKPA